MPDKLQTFLVKIAVIEGRHYIWPNMNSAVVIKIENQKKSTSVKFKSDCPYYNEYFVFEFCTTLEKLIDKNVTISVIKPGSILRKRKEMGTVIFDVGTVWYQRDHQFYHRWAILTAPKGEFVGGTRGYLKLDVSVFTKGEAPMIPKAFNTDQIEGNLLLPYGYTSGRQRVNFLLDLFRGEDFIKKHPLQEGGQKKCENPSSSFIEISFSENKVRTSVRKNTSAPAWHERLVIRELFPPLCHRFRVELYHGEYSKRAIRFLNLRNISNEKEEGFLPTFGPTFLHFYSQNPLEGYLGKILISFQSHLLGDIIEQAAKNDMVQSTPEIPEDKLLRYEDVVLFATIFDVSSLRKKYHDKPISFRMACGRYQTNLDESGDKFITTVTDPIKPRTTNRNCCFLPTEAKKPCLHLALHLPDTRKRMYNYNMLSKISQELKTRLDQVEDIFNNKEYNIASAETAEMLWEAVDYVISASAKYIDIASSYNLEDDTVLDREHQKISIKEMETVIIICKSIPVNKPKRRIFQKLEKIYLKIEDVINEIEDWPRVYFWMIYGNKRVAYYIMQPEDIIHSTVEEEKGIDCGVVQTIYFQTEETEHVEEFISMACKMNIVVWMGLARHWNDYLESFSSTFTLSPLTIPRLFIAKEKHEFQARAHVFQGRLYAGSDRSGLCDPFAVVIINGHSRQTRILKKTLNPLWDQTLIFKQIILYGAIEFMVKNPPTILIEIYDQDECCIIEDVGKCTVKPLVKTADEAYCPPKFPPKLSWNRVYNKFDVSAEILVAVELLELTQTPDNLKEDDTLVRIPSDIKPNMVTHRIEIVFWGVRNLKKVQMRHINKPKITIECLNERLTSDTLISAKIRLNFTNPINIFEAVFPEQQEYAPPLSLKMFDSRNFGVSVLAGTHAVPMWPFYYEPMTSQQREQKFLEVRSDMLDKAFRSSFDAFLKRIDPPKVETPEEEKPTSRIEMLKAILKKICEFLCVRPKSEGEEESVIEEEPCDDDDEFDWWTKFYASLEENHFEKFVLATKYKLVIYLNELEKQPQFENFTDLLYLFPMYKGKRTGDEAVDEANTTGVFKGALKIYRWPLEGEYVTPSGLPLEQGLFQDFPSNNPLRFNLRVYVVRGLGLRPRDLNGKSDPYLYVTLNDQVINDKENCIKAQINPTFGRCFEFNGKFPQDHTVTIAVYDWDALSRDDMIGETKIDLENRFYTKHRGRCGLAKDYVTSGYCTWRDVLRPATILENLCKKYNLSLPEYGLTSVTVGPKEFAPENFTYTDNIHFNREVLALDALWRWEEMPIVGCPLVPEHVETRSLYHPHKPGIEQGKLQLWVDIMPVGELPAPRPVNITPRKPVAYELRVVVWNAENIKLDEDDFFTGERKSDIYIKGWITGPGNSQNTDVHYRSLTGEANFNWRFIFPLEYLSTENKMVLKEKSIFGEKENKIPCRLTLQAWDNDTFSPNDFLGVVTLELSRLPRGARSASTCSLAILQPNCPVVNLFKIRRTKGWWPLQDADEDKQKQVYAGAVEVEFELLTQEDAERKPAGMGRDEPQALPLPRRPDTSFSWFWNPLKALKFLIKRHKWKLIKLAVFALLFFILFAGFYSVPGYSVKRILGA